MTTTNELAELETAAKRMSFEELSDLLLERTAVAYLEPTMYEWEPCEILIRELTSRGEIAAHTEREKRLRG